MDITVMPKMVKVNLDIEESLHKTIRKEAIDRGITMKTYLLELIEKGVRAKEVEGSEDVGDIDE
jgi:predicted DNA binding CopG/RHH family protein